MLQHHLQPIPASLCRPAEYPKRWGGSIWQHTDTNFPDLSQVAIALVGVGEADHHAANAIRQQLYRLFFPWRGLSIADLGNIAVGSSVADTQLSTETITSALLRNRTLPVLIADQSLPLLSAQIGSHQQAETATHIALIAPTITQLDGIHYPAQTPLDHCNHIGYQRHLTDPDLLQAQHHHTPMQAYSLGEISHPISYTEPLLRDRQMAAFDLAAIRFSHAAAVAQPSPNGFSAADACQIAHYAGMSDQLRSWSIHNYLPHHDPQQQTAALAAQMIWYFVNGYYERQNDFPSLSDPHYLTYRVQIKDSDDEILFLKSKKTDRWWMQLPTPHHTDQHLPQLLPCNYNDYLAATQGDLPDQWLTL